MPGGRFSNRDHGTLPVIQPEHSEIQENSWMPSQQRSSSTQEAEVKVSRPREGEEPQALGPSYAAMSTWIRSGSCRRPACRS